MNKQIALTAILLGGGLIAGQHYIHAASEAVDAVSAASLTLATGQIKDTSAVINYSKDKYNYGTRTLCWAVAPATPTTTCLQPVNASGNSGSLMMHPLKPGTSYNYSIKAVDTQGGERPYTSTGSLTTTGSSTSLHYNLVQGASRVPGMVVDVSGRADNAKHAAPSLRVVVPNR